MKKSTLLPCPFCGGPAEVSTGRPNGSGRTKTGVLFAVGCSSEDCLVDPMTRYLTDLDLAITYWNARNKDIEA
jgi:non-ribosomal peptide synthetase component E (peptide arylation enzyme)